MNLVNTTLLESFRTPGVCRWCGKLVRMRCAAHIMSKGAGQVDIRCNLVQLGMDALRDCPCHHDAHYRGTPGFDDLLSLSAVDHDCRPEDIVQAVHFIRRLDKGTTQYRFRERALELDLDARRLVMKEFEEFRHLLG